MGETAPRPVVLVVDDEPDHLMMLELLLDSFGYDVLGAASCAEGITLLGSRRFDALVADFFLGDGTALELLGAPSIKRPRFACVMSGLDEQEDIERTLAAGYDAHLVKPTGLDTLRDVLAEGLGRVTRPSGIRLGGGVAKAQADMTSGRVDRGSTPQPRTKPSAR